MLGEKPLSGRIGIAIGVLLGLVLGSAVGSPIFGAIIGGMVGWKIGMNLHERKKKAKDNLKEKIIDIPTIKKPKLNLEFYITIVILLFLIYYFRPWFHGLVMGFYTHPLLVFFIISILSGALFFKYKNVSAGSFFIFLGVISLVALFFNDVIVERYIVTGNEYNIIDTLPDSTQVRILPKAVARRYLEDSLQKSRERIGGLDIVNINNTLVWTAPRIPDGFVLFFTEPVNGLMLGDATKSDRTTKIVTSELTVGEGIGITDNIFWQLYKRFYLMNIDEIYYIVNNGNIKTVAPVITYKFRFPVMVPIFGGVFVVDPDGSSKFYNPEQIKDVEIFKDNWAYPESLARLYVNSYKYNLGILNAWFFHEDQIEIADVFGQANRQPFLMPTVDGLKWIIATEPWGESYGVFKIFLVDALTGRIDMAEMDEAKTLTGPVRVVSYVKKKFPIIDWATANVIEPRPYIIDGNLFWELSITPRDFAGISYTVFVNSLNNEVTAFQDDDNVYDFVAGKDVVIVESVDDSPDKVISDKDTLVADKIKEIEKQLDELKKLLG